MAITKSGKLMVKKASFGTAILAHLAQNAYGRNALNYPGQLGLGKLFLRGQDVQGSEERCDGDACGFLPHCDY